MTRHYDELGDPVSRLSKLIEIGEDTGTGTPCTPKQAEVVRAACAEAERLQRELMEADRARMAVERARAEAVRKHVMDTVAERLPS